MSYSKGLKALHRHGQMHSDISVNKKLVVVIMYFFLLESIPQLAKQAQELVFSIFHVPDGALHRCRVSGGMCAS